MQNEDITFLRRVFWGIHAPIAALLCVLGFVGLYVGLSLLASFSSLFPGDAPVRIATQVPVIGALAYWTVSTFRSYQHWSAVRRFEKKIQKEADPDRQRTTRGM
jgi:hypothetical protein